MVCSSLLTVVNNIPNNVWFQKILISPPHEGFFQFDPPSQGFSILGGLTMNWERIIAFNWSHFKPTGKKLSVPSPYWNFSFRSPYPLEFLWPSMNHTMRSLHMQTGSPCLIAHFAVVTMWDNSWAILKRELVICQTKLNIPWLVKYYKSDYITT